MIMTMTKMMMFDCIYWKVLVDTGAVKGLIPSYNCCPTSKSCTAQIAIKSLSPLHFTNCMYAFFRVPY